MTEAIQAKCCVVGGGPAGMMVGFLLARAGVEVIVLEKHTDFFRDFRGDTIHPSTLELIHELGLLDEFLKQPHQELHSLGAAFSDGFFRIADFSHLPTRCKFIALMPQWDFLNFVASHAKRYPAFHLRMEAEVTDLIQEDGRVAGVRAKTPQGELEVRAGLVIGADGRSSTVRERSGLEIMDLGAPIDVLWFRISRQSGDSDQTFGFVGRGHLVVLIDRGDYWQCGFVIPKGKAEEKRRQGLDAFRNELADTVPFLRERTGELKDWDNIKLLTVKVDRLRRWYRPGLLCIGDSAHAMSPVGGVGINLAIQDAAAAANLLASALREGDDEMDDLRKVQNRREWPTRMTQGLQIFLHNNVLKPLFVGQGPVTAPWPMRLMNAWPLLQRIPARLVGLGFRPEHVHSALAGKH